MAPSSPATPANPALIAWGRHRLIILTVFGVAAAVGVVALATAGLVERRGERLKKTGALTQASTTPAPPP